MRLEKLEQRFATNIFMHALPFRQQMAKISCKRSHLWFLTSNEYIYVSERMNAWGIAVFQTLYWHDSDKSKNLVDWIRSFIIFY